MSVVVAHQASNIGHLALQEAAKEAHLRQTTLSVIHVAEGVDLDVIEAHKAGLSDEIAKVLAKVGLESVDWTLQVTTGQDVAEAIFDVLATLDAELLVIGGRRRSPVGKLILGSITQTLILHADVPVVVVKEPASA